MNDPILKIDNFSFSRGGHQILEDVNLAVKAGEYLSIIGPNGAGKTTLLKCLMRIWTGGSGNIEIAGRHLAAYSQRELARILSYVPQSERQAAAFSVYEFVNMGRYPYLNAFTPETGSGRAVVDRAMAAAGVTVLSDRSVRSLSGGEQQKVLIAAALAQEPDVLLLDEPTTFLDPVHRDDIQRLLLALNREQGVTVVAVTHDLNQALMYSDRIAAIQQGRAVFLATPQEVVAEGMLDEVFSSTFTFMPHPHGGTPLLIPNAVTQPNASDRPSHEN